MALLADSIRFREPRNHFVVDLLQPFEAKSVKMISRRESLDAAKAGVFEATCQNNVAVDPVFPNDERGKTHSHLKCDPRFLREDDDRTVRLRGG